MTGDGLEPAAWEKKFGDGEPTVAPDYAVDDATREECEPLVRVSEICEELDKILLIPLANETDSVEYRVKQLRKELEELKGDSV